MRRRLSSGSSTKLFTQFATGIAHAAGRPTTFMLCCAVVIVWAVSGPFFGFSDTWQLIINTGTTVITFLMVFVIQNTQNRDGAALQAKLDELIRSGAGQNSFIGIERLSEEELRQMQQECRTMAEKEGRNLHRHEKAQIAADVMEDSHRRSAH